MANWCLPKFLADIFRQKVESGEIDPEKLSAMSSDERRSLFQSFLGKENADRVNANFEEKILLKNQKKGMLNWLERNSGLKPEVKKDLLDKITKLDRVLSQPEEDAFLKDLAARKLGVGVSMEEANKIAELAKAAAEKRNAINTGGDRFDYGDANVALENYVNELKAEASKRKLEDYKNPLNAVSDISGFAKGVKASLDNSAIFRQGWKTLFTDPKIWAKNAIQSFKDIKASLGGRNVMDGIRADIVSRPNALNGYYEKMKLDVGLNEEAFPNSLPEKIPLFGGLYKASEDAYNGFLRRMRADVADKLVGVAENQGVDLSGKNELASIGLLVNSLTGRGNQGLFGKLPKEVNSLLFSPKFLQSQIDVLTMHAGQEMSPFARKQAAKNLLKVVGGTALVMAIAKTLMPDSVELDPRGSDFGKVKVGDTRFDISGGMSSLVTLAARLITQSSKSTSGVVAPLGSGFGQQNGMDVVMTFLENKAAPLTSLVMDLVNQSDRLGNPLTLGGELANFVVPLPFTTLADLKNDPNAANVLVAMIADGLGIATNTYSATKDWTVRPGKELMQFQSKVGADKFKTANDEYNQKVADKIKALRSDERFNSLSDAEKATVITDSKSNIQTKVFKEYGFKYKKDKTKVNSAAKKLAK